jgi:hypothetical protein
MISKKLYDALQIGELPQTGRIIPLSPNRAPDLTLKMYKLGYDLSIFDDSKKKKSSSLWDNKKYEWVANEVMNYYSRNEEPPKEYIDYMLEVKKIKEEHGLL